MLRIHFAGRCAWRGALEVERSCFCQQSPSVSSAGGSGAPTSSPLTLDVESAVCAAPRSSEGDKPSGRRVGKGNK